MGDSDSCQIDLRLLLFPAKFLAAIWANPSPTCRLQLCGIHSFSWRKGIWHIQFQTTSFYSFSARCASELGGNCKVCVLIGPPKTSIKCSRDESSMPKLFCCKRIKICFCSPPLVHVGFSTQLCHSCIKNTTYVASCKMGHYHVGIVQPICIWTVLSAPCVGAPFSWNFRCFNACEHANLQTLETMKLRSSKLQRTMTKCFDNL